MSEGKKRPRIFWSKAALAFAGGELDELRKRLASETQDIMENTHDWFLHVVARNGEEDERILITRGTEEDSGWMVLVQLGEFRELTSEPGEAPLPEIQGMKPAMPRVIENDDNERFSEIA